MHAAVTCRPDMAFSVGTLSRHLQHPSQIHVDAAERVFKYLRYTADLSLCYGRLRSAHTFYGTCDASHAAVNFLGVTGWHFNFCGGAISWKRSFQKLISHSSTESELIALDEAAREPVYLQKITEGFSCQCRASDTIGQDNQSTIILGTSGHLNARTKHIALRFLYVNDLVTEGAVCMPQASAHDGNVL